MIFVTNSDILGKNIHHLRSENGLTREDLAVEIGWNPEELKDMEEGTLFDIDSEVFAKLCSFFHVDMDEIVKKKF